MAEPGTNSPHISAEQNPDVQSVNAVVDYKIEGPDLQATKYQNGEEDSAKNYGDLYVALDQKNRAIELLKRRLTNQQIQLAYYLHKNLGAEAVLEFSNQCIPHLAEDNMQLSLAMYKFIRDTGGKSRLANLSDRLSEYNQRVNTALGHLEVLVKRGMQEDEVENDADDDSVKDKDSDELRFSNKAFRVAHLDLCSRLMSSTLQVRKELEMFRCCAESVVKLEEERNALVDQVFALPAEQRFRNMRLAMLECDRRNKRQELQEGENATNPSVSTVSTDTSTDNDQGAIQHCQPSHHLQEVLRDMESEAMQLLILSEKQKNEFALALKAAQNENNNLRERLKASEEAASDDRVLQLQEKCVTIEREIEELRKETEVEQDEKEKEMQQLAEALQHRAASENKMQGEMRRMQATVDILRAERDSLQRRIEEPIKKECLTKDTNTDDYQEIIPEVDQLNEFIMMQEDQIKSLLTIMSGLTINEQAKGDTPSNEPTSTSPPEQQAPTKRLEESFDSGVCSPTSKLLDEFLQTKTDEPETCNIYYENKNGEFIPEKESDLDHSPIEDLRADDDGKMEYGSEIRSQSSRSRSRRRSFSQNMTKPLLSETRRGKLATTSLRVEAYDTDGKSESMHAVLECSSPLDGLLEMDNSSKLRLRLQYTSPSRVDYPDVNTSECQDSNCPFCPDRLFSGDHKRPNKTKTKRNHGRLSKDAGLYLTKQLNKIKSELKTANSGVECRSKIVTSINEIYSQLFGSEPPLTDDTNC